MKNEEVYAGYITETNEPTAGKVSLFTHATTLLLSQLGDIVDTRRQLIQEQ